MPLEFSRPFALNSDPAFVPHDLRQVTAAVTLAKPTFAARLTRPLNFQRPFGFSGDPAFGVAATDLRQVTAAVTLAKPIPAVQVAFLQRQLTLALTLTKPTAALTLSRIHATTLALALPAATPTVALSRIHAVTATLNLPAPGATLTALYDNNVFRGVIGQVAAPLQLTAIQNQAGTVRSPWMDSRRGSAANAARWGIPAGIQAGAGARHQQSQPADAQPLARFAELNQPLDSGVGSAFIQLRPVAGMKAGLWQFAARGADRTTRAGFIQLIVLDPPRLRSRWQWARTLVAPETQTVAGLAAELDRARDWIPWQWGRALTGVSVEPPEPIAPPEPAISTDLEFLFPFLLTTDIEFARFAPRRIPLRRTYFVLHEIAITRVADGAELHFAALTLSADTGSWGWSLSGNALGDATYARLTAAPFTEINVRINGIDWRFLVTSVSHARSFGKTGYSVNGVSPALALTVPLSDARSRLVAAPWTVNQLADQEVENTAWTVNWTAPDWLIPGNVWQYSQQTPLQALGLLAEAAGGFVQAERVNRAIQIAPRYPAWPWTTDWLFQSASWPVALLKGLQRSPKPGQNYNAVYVAGTTADGIMGYVKQAGTAGDRQPGPPLSNALITHADAARAFGGTYLADQANQTEVSFSTLLGGDAPLVELAQRIDLTEPGQDPQRILTQAVSISVQRGNNAVTVTQAVKGVSFDG